MISYELALKLQNAGFPINKTCFCEDVDCIHINSPTLSELIKECGPKFFSLNRHEGGCFVAIAIGDNLTSFIKTENASRAISPEEAVANLYLALAKK